MTISLKASPDGTYGEILVNGQVVAKLPVSGNAVIPNLVGTVSQSGGVPTGAVVERGSNANGEYVRFADGTQIVIKRFSLSSAIDIASYGGFISAFQVWGFPASFSATPALIAISEGNTSLGILAGTTNTSTTSFSWVAVSSQGVATRIVSAVAIGRWF